MLHTPTICRVMLVVHDHIVCTRSYLKSPQLCKTLQLKVKSFPWLQSRVGPSFGWSPACPLPWLVSSSPPGMLDVSLIKLSLCLLCLLLLNHLDILNFVSFSFVIIVCAWHIFVESHFLLSHLCGLWGPKWGHQVCVAGTFICRAFLAVSLRIVCQLCWQAEHIPPLSCWIVNISLNLPKFHSVSSYFLWPYLGLRHPKSH